MRNQAHLAAPDEQMLLIARLRRSEQDLQLLQRLAVELVVEKDPQAIYEAIVDAATQLMGSQFASMQMVVPGSAPRQLKLLASRGFDDAAVAAWSIVTPESLSSCSVAMGKGARAIVTDFEKADPAILNVPAYLAAGIRAAQSTPLVSRSGELVGMISTHWSQPHRPDESELHKFDILARQCADLLERREADRRKDEFLAILAHELRNPLAPVRMAAEILKVAPSGMEAEAAREIIDRQVAGLARLIDDLMDISRISQGKVQLRKEPTSLNAAIMNAAEATRPLMQGAGQSLVLTLSSAPLQVHGDPARLVQVFTNLLNNASKYSPEGSSIELSAAAEGGEAVVTVRDHGAGIRNEELEHIWEMFVQGDRSLERRQGGLGIGLTLVRSLVELHGGSVSASSDGPGQGSIFTVRLPLDSRSAASPILPIARGAAIPRLRVLVADDNVDAASSLGMLLKMSGCEVQTTHDGETAFETARRFRPNVALLDIGMPKLNGYELARRIKQEAWGQQMRLVAITGWGLERDRTRSSDAGFDSHLVKPVDAEALRSLLQEAAEEMAPARASPEQPELRP